MAATKVKGIVIGGVNIKEKDRLVSLYTLENGKMSLSMRGVRGEKAKMKFAKEIFCFGEYIIEEGKAGPVVVGVDIIDNFFGLSADIDKYYEGCAILDMVSKVSSESNPTLFIEIIKALKTLCYENCKKYYVFDKFLLSFLEINGWGFLDEHCSSCGATLSNNRYLNLEIGELVCPACKNALSTVVSDVCYNTLKILEKTPYEKLSTLTVAESGEAQACRLLVKDYELRTGNKILELK